MFRPNFAFHLDESSTRWTKKLKGKSARIVVTMGMPAFLYRWYFRAHGLKSLERNVLGFSGFGPIRESLIGMIEAKKGNQRRNWLEKMTSLGAAGQVTSSARGQRMDITEQRKTWHRVTKVTMYGSITVAIVLLLMRWFLI